MKHTSSQNNRGRLAFGIFAIMTAVLFSVVLVTASFAQQPGDLDPTFGNGGKVITAIGPGIYANATAIQPDGKIVAVGGIYGSNSDITILRYDADGSLDTTFDGDGVVTTPIGPFHSYASDVAIQPDGKIVAAGWSERSCDPSRGCVTGFALVRYNTNGSLDTTFDGDGIVITEFCDSEAYSIAIQPDGKIVAMGDGVHVYICGYDEDGNPVYCGDSYFLLDRYNPNGSLDATFGVGGIVATTPAGSGCSGCGDVTIQPDGKIVTAQPADSGSGYDFSLFRYNTDGSPDTTFGVDGRVRTDTGRAESAQAVVVQPDGKIVAAGGSQSGFTLIRYNSNGSLDTEFDGDGIVTTKIDAYAEAYAVAIQPDGKIVAAGGSGYQSEEICGYDEDGNPLNCSYSFFALVRYNTNGSLDTTFGGGDGMSTVDFKSHNAYAFGMAFDGQGRAVLAGTSRLPFDNDQFALARIFLEGGPLAPHHTPYDFDGDGKADRSVFRPADGEWYLDRSRDGLTAYQWGLSTDKVVAADYDGDGITDPAVYRPSEGTWWIINSHDGSVTWTQWGISTDIPVPADYDGDGRADMAVYRGEGQWWILSSKGGSSLKYWGYSTDIPVPADYDGDGMTDPAVYRGDGQWWVLNSKEGSPPSLSYWGLSTDKPIPADYDGDGKTDLAVYRGEGQWWVLNSNGGPTLNYLGQSTDKPVPKHRGN